MLSARIIAQIVLVGLMDGGVMAAATPAPRLQYVALLVSGVLGVAGLTCIYLAYFLYEPEERAIQQRLEEWWVIVETAGAETFSKHQRFVFAASEKVLTLLEHVFGPRLLTIRAMWPAAFFSFGAVSFTGGTEFLFSSDVPLASLAHFGLTIMAVLLGLVPSIFAARRVLTIGCSIVVLGWIVTVAQIAFLVRIVVPEHFSSAMWFFAGMSGTLVLGTVAVLGLVAVMRWGIRVCGSLRRASVVAGAVALQVVGVVLLVRVPLWIAFDVMPKFAPPGNAELERFTWWDSLSLLVGGVSMTALGAVWPVGAFLLTFVLLLVHRVVWPVVSRPIYAAQRHQIVSNRKVLGRVGVMLLLLSGIPGMAFIVKHVSALM